MDALKDIWASLVNGVRERTTNPLSFAFMLSWCAWNFKFFVVLLGDGTAAVRLADIDLLYPANSYTGGALLYPAITAAIYVFLYPFVSAEAIKFYRRKQVEISNSVKGLEEKRILTVEESTEQTRRHEAVVHKHYESESRIKSELSEVRQALAAAEKEVRELKVSKELQPSSQAFNPVVPVNPAEQIGQFSEIAIEDASGEFKNDGTSKMVKNLMPPLSKPSSIQLEKLQLKILIHVSGLAHGANLTSLSNLFNTNYTVTEVAVKEMQNSGLLHATRSGNWELTDRGKSKALNLLANL